MSFYLCPTLLINLKHISEDLIKIDELINDEYDSSRVYECTQCGKIMKLGFDSRDDLERELRELRELL